MVEKFTLVFVFSLSFLRFLYQILAPTEPIEAPGLKPPKWQDPVSTDPSIRVEGLDRLPSASDLYK